MVDNGGVTRTAGETHPQLVIFDLDGTLTDSAAGVVASFRHALAEIGAEVPEGDRTGRPRRRGPGRLPSRLHQPRLGDEHGL